MTTAPPPDRRSLPANDRVAHASLEGQVEGLRLTEGEAMRIGAPLADLRDAPDGTRDKQMLRGQGFVRLETRNGWAFGFDAVDGYVGWLPAEALVPQHWPTHRVVARASHVYAAPDVKAPERAALSFFCELEVAGEAGPDGAFAALAGGGHVPAVHLRPLSWVADDAASVAELFLGTPYLWGGNSASGIDCSGLVQLALHAAGRSCPRDTDQQEAAVGRALAGDAPLRRGDLVFWAGHVGMMANAEDIVHANAHHMATVREPLAEAARRIEAAGGGPITARRRP